MARWRGSPGIRERLIDLFRGHDDALLWLAIALLLVGTLGHVGSRSREADYATLAMAQARTSGSLSIENASGRDVVVMTGSGEFAIGYRLAAGAHEPFLRIGGPLRVMDPVTCATLATLDYPRSGSVVLGEGGRADFVPGDQPDATSFLDADISSACDGHVRAEAPPIPHPGTIVGIGDDRLWSSAADGSVARFLPSDRMPISASPLASGRWLVSTTTGWQGLNAGVINRWIVDPATNTWTSFHDDLASVAFSPDGRWAAFIRRGTDRTLRLALAEDLTKSAVGVANANAERALTTDVDSFSWSPDSSRILVASTPDRAAHTMKVELVDLSGNTSVLLAEAGRSVQPVWSPDGKRVVAGLAGPDGWAVNQLLVLGTSGELIGSIQHAGEELAGPSFSPDGRHLAFDVIRYPYPNNAQVGQLMIAAADGSNPVASVDWLLGDGPAVWSPDGSAFVVERMEEMGPDQLVMGFGDGQPWKPIAERLVPLVWLPEEPRPPEPT